MISLTELEEGKTGKVVEIIGGRRMYQKLDGLGIRVGIKIKKISALILRGPVVVEVGNTQVAIGYGMAKRIVVEIEK